MSGGAVFSFAAGAVRTYPEIDVVDTGGTFEVEFFLLAIFDLSIENFGERNGRLQGFGLVFVENAELVVFVVCDNKMMIIQRNCARDVWTATIVFCVHVSLAVEELQSDLYAKNSGFLQ